MYRYVVVACSAVLAVARAAPPGGFYATKYDHINVDTILNTRRLVNYYAACLTDKGPCTPQGLEFKRILPEALQTNCLRCTEKQRVVTYRAIRRLKKEYPKVWQQMAELWDPSGDYVRKFEETYDDSSNAVIPTTTQTPDFIKDRFGDSSSDSITSKPFPAPPPTTNIPKTTSTQRTNIQKITTTSTTTTPSTTTTTHKTTTTYKTTTKPVVTYPPAPSIGTDGAANNIPGFQAAVSVNTNLGINGLVRRLGSVGSKVIQAGTRIAGVLISTVQTVVGH